MSGDLVERLSEGRSLLLRLGSQSSGVSGSGQQNFRGDFSVWPMELESHRVQFDLTWFGMASKSISTTHGQTGRLSISGISGVGEFLPLPGGKWSLDMDFRADVLYDAIENVLGLEETDPGLFEPPTERFRGRLRASLAEEDGQADPRRPGLIVLSSDLELSYIEGGLGWISDIRLPSSAIPPLAALSQAPAPSCPMGRKSERRVLTLRPFAFRDGPNDALHSGTSWNGQLNAAKAIWGSCCLQLESEPLRFIDDADLKDSSDPERIRQALPTGSDLAGIEVFLVNGIPSDGGGSTSSPGHLQAKVVMTNRNSGNPNLLAHELGHVLAGRHPGASTVSPLWTADPGTVLDPSNSPSSPNPSRNTLNNCRRARNPALVPTGNACCIPSIVV